jgi:hypothetical protein
MEVIPKLQPPASGQACLEGDVMKKTLAETLAYRNPAVVARFAEVWPVSLQEAEDVFDETLKWLWLGAKIRQEDTGASFKLVVTPGLRIIDEMWHTFLLFTQAYRTFCEDHFGAFLDHGPTTVEEHAQAAAERARDPEAFMAGYAASMRAQCLIVCAELGDATAEKWYSSYLDRYGDSFFELAKTPMAPRANDRTPARAATSVMTSNLGGEERP